MGWSTATLSRTETGKRHITSEDTAALLAIYGIPADQRNALVNAARATNGQAGWWSRPLPGVSHDADTLAGYESSARALTNWSLGVIPGMMQTEEYSTNFMAKDGATPEEARTRWTARLNRQKRLPTLDYVAYIHETALHVLVGGAEVLKGQLKHLHDAHTQGHSIRVVRAHVSTAALIHSWLLLEFPQDPPVVHIELMNSTIYLHDAEVSPYLTLRAELDRIALSGPESRGVIRQTMERL
ncbi:hypothetical protein SAMN05216174_11150 [Actinokineospora iranica]|uniref:DUF5753 domain-containing protein n=2 Tax=Actinokineospora iranica TaxID=1271860 RepID=A0A1G6UR04_9PSEU|nr:hypothetical protein SAMN05216174_11150 [Actinokineospora iranica]